MLDNYLAFFLMFARMVGFVVFNPLFGKKNVPVMIRVIFCAALAFSAFLIFDTPLDFDEKMPMLGFCTMIFLELAFGFLLGFCCELAMSVLTTGGELIDTQMGFSMNRLYNPAAGSETAISGALVGGLFTLVFFLTNSHLNLVNIIFQSFRVLPIGKMPKFNMLCSYLLSFNKNILTMSLKIAMPMVAAILIMDIGLGVLMKAAPQINVFVLNVYVKFIIGFILLLKLCPMFVEFSHNLTDKMFSNIESLLAAAMRS
ncbi:MAG: flagellar biosynthetic protein FliR [Oscillospiraceae bacterium]|nr:flagellar biosynthetic protein FliR [Oscillospiraceae bacterium]